MEIVGEVMFPLFVGAVGALAVEFVARPLGRYRELRAKVAADLVFYANVFTPGTFADDLPTQRFVKRNEEYRRSAAEILAWYAMLPEWLRPRIVGFWRRFGGVMADPTEAASELIGLSNTTDPKQAQERVNRIRDLLKIARIA